jgi:hypothetical protein
MVRQSGVRRVMPVSGNEDILLCSCTSGAVGTFSARKGAWENLSINSHTETVFECAFK